ncbi:MAG TPA: ABC transporter substrate-binding protein, partial [Kiloniellales bacterium]|nr:ABC transporter substrate-binding protein [Kiloniellales bacterium]
MSRERTTFLAAMLLAGTAMTSAAAADETLRVGVIGNQSGVFAVFGETMVKGVEMAVEEAGGTAGDFDIELFIADDEGNPELAITRLRTMDTRD